MRKYLYNACLFLVISSFYALSQETGNFTDSRDNHVYNWVKIGDQVWMAENLTYLPTVSSPSTGSISSPYYYVYGYEGTNVSTAKATSNYTTYGGLYNWPAAMNGAASSSINPSGVQGICPSGWHLPSNAEWIALTDYLGGIYVAGGKMKEAGSIHWESPNTGATNESGFNALPNGGRFINGTFDYVGIAGIWWTTTMESDSEAWTRWLLSLGEDISSVNNDKGYGYSIRCIKDETPVNTYDIDISFEPWYSRAIDHTENLKTNQFIGRVYLKSNKEIENVKIEAILDNNSLECLIESIDTDNDEDIDKINTITSDFCIYSKEFANNIEDKDLHIRVTSIDGQATNFEYHDKISMYFAKSKEENNRPFMFNKDIYRFNNPTGMSLKEFSNELANYYYKKSELLLIYKVFYPIMGRCYGMASSAGAYFLYPELKPEQDYTNEQDYPYNWGESPNTIVLSKINAYHISQIAYDYEIYEPNNFYDGIKTHIKNSNPVIIGLSESKSPYKKHAVLVVKITEYNNGNSRTIHLYENGRANETGLIEYKTTNSFDTKDYSLYDEYTFFPQEAFLEMDPTVAIYIHMKNLTKSINVSAKKIFAAGCPVNMYITDEKEKRSGYLPNGSFVNEITNAEIYRIPTFDKVGDSITYIYAPSSDNYKVEIYCYDKGQVRFEYYEPNNSDQIKTVWIDEISIETGDILSFNDNSPELLSIDNNGDGNIDYSLNTVVNVSSTSNIESQETNLFNIYPNPSSDKIFFEYHNPNDELSEFEIYNSLGQMTMKSKFNEYDVSWIDISILTDGIYYLKLKSLKGLVKGVKLIKE